MNIAFFGSPPIARTILAHLHEKFPVSLVVSQPDNPVGRKQVMTPTAVSSWAVEHGIPLVKESSSDAVNTKLRQYNIDIALVVAYGIILKKQTLEIPQFGFLNVHYSLLPKYRGASPVQYAILNGEHETGVTIMNMDEDLDHGPIISQRIVSISPDDTTGSLLEKLTSAAIPLLESIITTYETHQPPTFTQDHAHATYTRRLTKQDGYIEFGTLVKAVHQKPLTQNDAPTIVKEYQRNHQAIQPLNHITIHNFIRALSPWPGVWTINAEGKRIKILSSTGENGKLVILRHQEEGKTPVETPEGYFSS